MNNLVSELKALLKSYAKEQKASWSLDHNEEAKTLHASLVSVEELGNVKAASVFYGPEDFEQDDPTAADIFEHLKKTWEDADK